MLDYALARLNMVESQLRPNRVTNLNLLELMGSLPRESFVPEAARSIAYVDETIALSDSHFMLEPMVLARLLQELNITSTDRVLDIAAGTGYTAAILAGMAAKVIAVEESQPLVHTASQKLAELGRSNVEFIVGSYADGYASGAPYNAIILEGAVTAVPATLLNQLAEGGRLVAVIMNKGPVGQARLYHKVEGQIGERVLFDAGAPLLPSLAPAQQFVF